MKDGQVASVLLSCIHFNQVSHGVLYTTTHSHELKLIISLFY